MSQGVHFQQQGQQYSQQQIMLLRQQHQQQQQQQQMILFKQSQQLELQKQVRWTDRQQMVDDDEEEDSDEDNEEYDDEEFENNQQAAFDELLPHLHPSRLINNPDSIRKLQMKNQLEHQKKSLSMLDLPKRNMIYSYLAEGEHHHSKKFLNKSLKHIRVESEKMIKKEIENLPIEDIKDGAIDKLIGLESSEKLSLPPVEEKKPALLPLLPLPLPPKPQNSMVAYSHTRKNVSLTSSRLAPSVTCLLIPVNEPVFADLKISNLRIINPIQKQAIIQMAESNKEIGLVYIRDPNFKSYNIIQSSSDIHEFGIAAKISSYAVLTEEEDALKPLIATIKTLRVFHLKHLAPPKYKNMSNEIAEIKKGNIQSFVCLGNVVPKSVEFSKKDVIIIRKVLKEVLKKLSLLYYKSKETLPEFNELYLLTLQENCGNLKEKLKVPIRFYSVEDDSVILLNAKINIIGEILKHYFIIKIQKYSKPEEKSMKLQYFNQILYSISINLRLVDKVKDVLNVVEVELSSYDKKIPLLTSSSSNYNNRPNTAGDEYLDLSDTDSFLDSLEDEKDEISKSQSPIVETPGSLNNKGIKSLGITYLKNPSDLTIHNDTGIINDEESSDDTLLSSFSETKPKEEFDEPIQSTTKTEKSGKVYYITHNHYYNSEKQTQPPTTPVNKGKETILHVKTPNITRPNTS